MRFGLVGTGPWAELAHGPGLPAARGVELVGVWGRTPSAARALLEAAGEAGVAAVVFFTDRFVDATRTWIDDVRRTGGWHGGWVRWFSALHEPGNPFGASPWRHQAGASWDTGPHSLSTLVATLGPIESVTAVPGVGDEVCLIARHGSGHASTIALTQFGPPAASQFTATLWGEGGFTTLPPRPEGDFGALLARAAEELVSCAASGQPHELDLRFGVRVVELLFDAQEQLGRPEVPSGPPA